MKKNKDPKPIAVYFTEEEKEALSVYMLTNSYHISFSTYLREIILKALNIKI